MQNNNNNNPIESFNSRLDHQKKDSVNLQTNLFIQEKKKQSMKNSEESLQNYGTLSWKQITHYGSPRRRWKKGAERLFK